MLPKTEQAAKIKSDRGYEYKIQIDGSVNGKTFKRLSDAGAEVYILGSSGLFNLDEDLKDRKSTRLNSSHVAISYAVFCLKKKKRVQKKTVAVLIKHKT